MIRRFYVHNFRCLENFELPIAGMSSVLLIGNNGSGKSTVAMALRLLQRIGRGTNRVGELIKPKDMAHGRTSVPVRFEIQVEIDQRAYEYGVAFEFPEGFKELRVLDERFVVEGNPIYSRTGAQVNLVRTIQQEEKEAQFRIDWHLVALPIVQEQSRRDPLFIFKRWLANALVLRPVPSLISGESEKETLYPDPEVRNLAEWFSGLLAYAPAAYAGIDAYLRQVIPDLKEIRNPQTGKDSRSLEVQFANSQASFTVDLENLSDGEKCFLVSALVLAANRAYGPLFCFWDEPDNYLAVSEVQHFVSDLRMSFQNGGQFVATSHNPEAIQAFPRESTFLLHREGHLEPTVVRPLEDLNINGDLVSALIRGDVEP